MTSQINPADIDGNYPIAGVSNNTQGMRDNFTNTRTNFQYAADEITDLQNKAVLKAALSGTTLDNNLGNNVVYNALVKGISGTVVAIANTSGTITIDCSAGPYQSINMAGNIGLSFTSNTWPTAGTLGMVRTQITVDQVGRTLTLPNTVSNGIVGIQGYSSNVITFANTGTYEFGFSTTNAGNAITIVDLNRPLSYYTNGLNIAANTVSTSSVTGALTVAGGVGISGNLYVSGNIVGNIVLTSSTFAGNVTAGNLLTGGLVSATGNVTGGNINTAGLSLSSNVISALNVTGAIAGANVTTPGLISAAGNVTGGNIITGAAVSAGSVSSSGNITGGNVLGGANVNATTHTGTTVSVTGNITGGNINAAGLSLSSNVVSALNVTGAIAGANLTTPGLISATGNITGGNVNTGIVSASGNIVAGNVNTGIVSASGNVIAGNLNAAGLSLSGNVVSAINLTANITTTANIQAGNLTSSGIMSVTANITGGNILTGGLISSTANITGGNILTGGLVSSTGNILTNQGNILVTGGTGGVGYTAGAGGTIVQSTNKSTGVTLDKQSGAITMNGAALTAATIVSFVLTNSTIGANDLLLLQHQSGGTLGAYTLNAAAAAGSATIYVRNETAGSLSEALVIRYAVIKGAVA